MRIHIQLPFVNGGIVTLEGESPEALVPSLNWLASLGVIPSPSAYALKDAGPSPDQPPLPEELQGTQPPLPEELQGTQTAQNTLNDKPKATRKKAEPKAEPEQEKAPKLTIADVTDAVTRLANKKGVAVARGLIGKYGVAKASEVKPEDFAAFIADAKAMIAVEEAAADEELPL